MDEPVKDRGDPELVRAVGLASLFAIALNGGIGAGVFVLPAAVARILGPARPTAYLVAALVGGLGPLLLFAIAGLVHASAGAASFRPPAWGPLKQASLILIFAFGGFESASVPSEELVNARRHLPIALVGAVAATAVLYVAIQIAALGALPDLGSSPTPLA